MSRLRLKRCTQGGVGCTARRGPERGAARWRCWGRQLLLGGLLAPGTAGDGNGRRRRHRHRAAAAEGDRPVLGQPGRQAPPSRSPPTRRRARRHDAGQIRKIAEQPTGEWIGPENPEDAGPGLHRGRRRGRTGTRCWSSTTSRTATAASSPGAAPPTATPTARWIDSVAEGIGDRPATVILEPDAVLHMVDNCTPRGVPRGALRPAQGRRRASSPVAEEHEGLPRRGQRRLGQARTRSSSRSSAPASTRPTASRSTSRTSTPPRTPSPTASSSRRRSAASPSSSTPAATATGPTRRGDPRSAGAIRPAAPWARRRRRPPRDPLVDAYLWVKRPGESDGECKGGPKAGDWWPEYALGLAQASQ